MEVYITHRPDHFPQKYLAQWQIGGVGYQSWFHTQKEVFEYLARWNAKIIATNFDFKRKKSMFPMTVDV